MSSDEYAKLAELLGLGPREIARRTGVTPTTVSNILANKRGAGLYSKTTEQRIYAAIEAQAQKTKTYLNKLSGGATE